MSPFPSRPGRRPSKVSRGWIGFFVVLALLTAVAIFVEMHYNQTTPLTAALLAEAQRRWKEHGPRDYDLDYTIKTVESTQRYQVQVRNGQATSVVMNDSIPLEPRLYSYYTMPGLFSSLENFLEQDSETGRPRTFTTVVFDPVDGHLIHYVRSVAVKRERQEIRVRLTPVTTSGE